MILALSPFASKRTLITAIVDRSSAIIRLIRLGVSSDSPASPWATRMPFAFMDDFNELDDDLFNDSIYKNLDTFDIGRIGAFFESHPVFPERSSIEFAICISEGIRVRVFDRGCGETLACGTGACAVGVAAALTGRGPRVNKIYLPGGVLDIDWASNNHVMMSGSAQYVYAGTYEIPEL